MGFGAHQAGWMWALAAFQITAIDLLLSADNAVVIALACRGLAGDDLRLVTVLGTGGAVLLRLIMACFAAILLRTPYLKLVGAAALLYIALRVTLESGGSKLGKAGSDGVAAPPRGNLLLAAGMVVAADAVMSLDNVVAVAAIANGDLLLLGLGLALSVPMLVWGSAFVRQYLDEHFVLVMLSGTFLGWVAGDIAVADPGVAPWIAGNAPALPYAAPIAGAIFVLWQYRILSAEVVP